jgi:hypothetical protein
VGLAKSESLLGIDMLVKLKPIEEVLENYDFNINMFSQYADGEGPSGDHARETLADLKRGKEFVLKYQAGELTYEQLPIDVRFDMRDIDIDTWGT